MVNYNVGNVVKWPKTSKCEWVVVEIQQGNFLHLVSMGSHCTTANVSITEVKFLASCVSSYVAQLAGV